MTLKIYLSHKILKFQKYKQSKNPLIIYISKNNKQNEKFNI